MREGLGKEGGSVCVGGEREGRGREREGGGGRERETQRLQHAARHVMPLLPE